MDNWLRGNFPAIDLTANHNAKGGHNTFSSLVRLTAEVLSSVPNVLVMDFVNDNGGNFVRECVEALVRRVWTVNRGVRIIFVKAFSLAGTHDVNTPDQLSSGQFADLDAIAAQYEIPVVDYWSAVKTLVAGGALITTYVSGDWVHPTATGYALLATLVEALLPYGGKAGPVNLPARIYDNGDYENTPTKINGTAYNARSGTWADSGGQVSSSTVGSTITYIATCQSFGCYRVDGLTNDVTVSIDGGAFVSMVFYQNGVEIAGGRAAHTIVIKVNSGTVKIDEFWAV